MFLATTTACERTLEMGAEVTSGRNAPCPCGSGKKYKKCCLNAAQPQSAAQPIQPPSIPDQDTKTFVGMFKPVHLFGVLPITASQKAGMKGAVVQFVIPDLTLTAKDGIWFGQLASVCHEDVESADFRRGSSDPGQRPLILVSISFHVMDDGEDEDVADLTGRLIAERFLSLTSYAIGERVIGQHQQVSVAKEGGRYSVRLHPERKWADKERRIALPLALVDTRPDSDTFKALFWLRRGLSDHDPLDAFAALVVALEILASVLVPPDEVVHRCPKCNEEIGKRTTNSIKQLVTGRLGASASWFERLWTTRNAVVAHGGRAVTPRVLVEVVELRLEAIRLVFKALGMALRLPPETAPTAAPIVMFTDAFLKAE